MNPIRFQCQSCSQPIEVDEEWADKTVACPYCKATVTAPAETTLTELDQIHTASPISTPAIPAVNTGPNYATPLIQSRNTVAVVALSLSILLIVLFITSASIITPHRMEMEHFQQMIQSAESNTKSQMHVLEEFTNQYGGALPGWFIAITLIQGISIPIFIAAVVCGIIGVRRQYRKKLAIISLAICSSMVFFLIANVMLS